MPKRIELFLLGESLTGESARLLCLAHDLPVLAEVHTPDDTKPVVIENVPDWFAECRPEYDDGAESAVFEVDSGSFRRGDLVLDGDGKLVINPALTAERAMHVLLSDRIAFLEGEAAHLTYVRDRLAD